MPTIGSTPNFSLQLPYGNRQNWTDIVNGNFRTIDALIATYVSVTNLKGLWENNTEYVIGDNVVDETSGVVYTCQVANTSSSAPTTFAEERAAFTTYWLTFATAARNRGAWATATAYALNDFVLAGSTKYAMCVSANTSGVTFAADLALGYWTVLIDLSTAGSLVLPVLSGAADANKVVMSDSGGNSYTINTPTALAALMTTLATLANPTFTGNPIAPTQTAEDNDTSIATTQYADRAVRNLVIRVQAFTGSGTYTPHAKMIYAIAKGVGGGGGGASLVSAAATGYFSGGGGGGGYSEKIVSAADIGASKAVTIGAGGAGSTAGSLATATAGGDTSLGVLLVAKGGSGGATIPGAGNYGVGGAGGIAGTGDTTFPGQKGGPAAQFGIASFVGSGGGWGGASQIGAQVYTPIATAASVTGTSGGANAGNGGGSGYCLNGSDAAGGVGGSGYLWITEFCWG